MSWVDFQYFRKILRENGYELVRRGKTTYIRRRPWTRNAPTAKMLRARGAMKLASKTGVGTRGFDEKGMPIVASQNRARIKTAMLFLKVTAPERRVAIATQVADEIGLEPEEKQRLIKLVRG